MEIVLNIGEQNDLFSIPSHFLRYDNYKPEIRIENIKMN